jgi:hypothetical protein
MPIPTDQVMQLIADNLAMINKLAKQLKIEQDDHAHIKRLFEEQTVINKKQAKINKEQTETIKQQAQEINDQAVIINRLRQLLQKAQL